jgi:hypothetical protein
MAQRSENSDAAVAVPASWLSFRRRTTTEQDRITNPQANVSPSPWGEGWGEGERSKLQPEAHDDSRNCQTSRVPRQGRGFTNLVMKGKSL